MSLPSRQTPWRYRYAILWSGQLLATVGLMMLVPLMPFYIGELPGGAAHLDLWTGLALAAPALTVVLTAPWWGGRSDRWPRRRSVVLCFSVFAISMALMAVGWSVEGFVLARLLQGASGLTVVLTACVVADAPHEVRGRALGTLQSATAAGCVIGPVLGGMLIDHWTPALLLWATSLGTALCALAAWWLFKEGEAPVRVPAQGHPCLAELLRAPGFLPLIATGVLTQTAAFAALPAFAALARDLTSGQTASFVGFTHSIGWFAALLAAPWWGRRNDCGLAHGTLLLASLGCALAIAIQPFVTDSLHLIPLRLAQGFFFAGTAQTIFFLTNQRVSEAIRGRAVGLTNSVLTGGQILGPLGAALLLPVTGAPTVLWIVAALFLGGTMIMSREPVLSARFFKA